MWPFSKSYKDPRTVELPTGLVCLNDREYANLNEAKPVFRWAEEVTTGAVDCIWTGRVLSTIFQTKLNNATLVSQSLGYERDTLNGVMYGTKLTGKEVEDHYYRVKQMERLDPKKTVVLYDNLQLARTEV